MLVLEYQNVIKAQGYNIPYSLVGANRLYMGGAIAYENTVQGRKKIHWTPIPEASVPCPKLSLRYQSDLGMRFPEDGDTYIKRISLSYIPEFDLSSSIAGVSIPMQRAFLQREKVRDFRILYPQSGNKNEIILFFPLQQVLRNSCKYTQRAGYELWEYLDKQGWV